MKFKKPLFLNRTFFSDGDGFFYSAPPSVDLLDNKALQDDSPWVVLSAVLERAKHGDFSKLGLVLNLVREADNYPDYDAYVFIQCCADLLIYAGNVDTIKNLRSLVVGGSDILKNRFSYTVCHAGYFLMINDLISILDDAMGDYEEEQSIGTHLSFLLEPFGASHFSDVSQHDPNDLIEMVNSRSLELKNIFSTSNIILWHGEEINFSKLCEKMVELAGDRSIEYQLISMEFQFLRRRFEAPTGINCSLFYKNNKFQPQVVLDIVGDFLDKEKNLDRFNRGKYFFGHKVS